MAIFKLKTGYLPLLSCIWVSPTSIIAAGHDCTPLVFQVDASGQVRRFQQFYQFGEFLQFCPRASLVSLLNFMPLSSATR
jgi:hypothetical protein